MSVRGYFDDNFCKMLTKSNMMISNEQIPALKRKVKVALQDKKNTKEAQDSENDSINKVQSVCWGTW